MASKKFKRNRRRFKKRFRRRKYRKRSRLPSPWKGYGKPFPEKRKIKYHYKAHWNQTTSAGTVTAHIMRLNSVYDPEYAVGGQQPRYMDQTLSGSLYQVYQVMSCKFKLDIVNKSASDAQVLAQITTDAGLNIATTPDALWEAGELPNTYQRILMPNTLDGSRTSISSPVAIWKHFSKGYSAFASARGNYSSQYNGNPGDELFLKIYVADNPQSGGTANVDFYITMEFNTIVFQNGDYIPQS